MIIFDKTYNQLLTNACLTCQDEHFQPPIPELPVIGCCSYSPVFTLFEIHNMVKINEDFFYSLYSHQAATIHPFTIFVEAEVHATFHLLDLSPYSKLERDDLKTSYSICQFFKNDQGCSLHPSFKNAVCRSFICTTVEDALSDNQKQQLAEWTNAIQKEVQYFLHVHKHELEKRSINLINEPDEVVAYLKSI
ncbi:hypothetical protein [Halalkalibacter urbisdiaboli]|uniref:hypothetical protein n=1 Tax=Halalkalibacter urbisdiaboli TaxID=1960589 RepID=UPI000B43A83A|nr:hypothetical protein [Halalkalibacter urbisdiaboli]